MKRTTLLLFAAFFFHVSFVRTVVIVAAEKASWQLDWEKTVQAAKQEAQISIYAALGPYDPQIFVEFQKEYPDIKATITHGSSNRISPRLFAERRAGKYLADVYLGGPTSLYSFYKNDLFDPLGPVLVLPEVVNTSLWWEGKHLYIDPERKYIFINEGSVSGFTITYNTQLAKASEFKSLWDLFQPKWKGKIVSLDARDPGFGASELRYVYYHPELGPQFIRRLFGEMDIVLSREHKQAIDWVGAGKLSLCVFCRDGFASAAKVFINWFLSRRGQIVYQESHGDRDSLRIDIPKEKVPAAQRRVAGRKYFFVETPEFMDVKPAMKIVEDALGGKGR